MKALLRQRARAPHCAHRSVVLLLVLGAWSSAGAGELHLSLGSGPQPGGDQTNRLASVDFSFYTFERSERQRISVGIAYTRLTTDTALDDSIEAITIYPEFSFYPAVESRIRKALPTRGEPYFFMRFLGPSYISENTLGGRRQDNHFSFLAELGVGMRVDFGGRRPLDFRISWKHFSNARWFDHNDGIDVPFVIGWGLRF